MDIPTPGRFDIVRDKKKNPSSWTGTAARSVRDKAGFTLVEVLIASMILFSGLAIGALAYSTSVRLLGKVTASAVISGCVPDIVAQVKENLLEKKLSGEARYNDRIRYSWKTEEIRSSRNIRGRNALGGIDYGVFQVSLHTVALTVIYEADGVEKTEGYAYQELLWYK